MGGGSPILVRSIQGWVYTARSTQGPVLILIIGMNLQVSIAFLHFWNIEQETWQNDI